jgi:hypothetical protein
MKSGKTSKALEISRRRLERLQSIDPQPDFGSGLSIAGFESTIDDVAVLEADYNKSLSESDTKRTALRTGEKVLLDYRERILSAIAFKYGKDSEEYVAAGGTRKSERKRPRPRKDSSTPTVEN